MSETYEERVRRVLIKLSAEVIRLQARCEALEQLVPPELQAQRLSAFDKAHQKMLDRYEDENPGLAAELDDRAVE